MDGLTPFQRRLADSMLSMEGSDRGLRPRRSYKLVCERGIGVTEAVVRLCASGAGTTGDRCGVVGGSIVVFPHVLGEQMKGALRRADPAGLGTTVVTNAAELAECAALARRRRAGEAPPGVLLAVTDTFFRRTVDRLEDINHDMLGRPGATLFGRAAFDDARSLNVPVCAVPVAGVVWTVVGRASHFCARGFIGKHLGLHPPVADGTVWCDGRDVATDAAAARSMFGRDAPRADAERSLVPWRPSGVVDTARLVAEASAHDPSGVSALVGTVEGLSGSSWRGWREGGDRSCPVCLCEPAESVEESGGAPVLRVRTACCGREFCAGCIAKSLVSRAESGLPPSCPQCRDCFGGCLETCAPVIVSLAPGGVLETSHPDAGRLAGIKTFNETLTDAMGESLDQPEARVLVVAPSHQLSICRSEWFRLTCCRGLGVEVLSGSTSRVAKALARYRAGGSRVMVVESGPLKELGVRMPWVTHVLMLDCFDRSSHWLMRTAACPIETALSCGNAGRRSPRRPLGASGGVGKASIKVRRLVPARYILKPPPGGAAARHRFGEPASGRTGDDDARIPLF